MWNFNPPPPLVTTKKVTQFHGKLQTRPHGYMHPSSSDNRKPDAADNYVAANQNVWIFSNTLLIFFSGKQDQFQLF